jgi:hypothetical protein
MIPRHLENAHFNPPPAAPSPGQFVSRLWADLWSDAGENFWRAMVPNQAGVLWIAIAVMLVVAFDFARPANARNFELIALLANGFLLFNIMRFFELLGDPTYFWVMDLVFTGIVAVSLSLIGARDLARAPPAPITVAAKSSRASADDARDPVCWR